MSGGILSIPGPPPLNPPDTPLTAPTPPPLKPHIYCRKISRSISIIILSGREKAFLIGILRICQGFPCDEEVIASCRSFVIGICLCIGHVVCQAEGKGIVSRFRDCYFVHTTSVFFSFLPHIYIYTNGGTSKTEKYECYSPGPRPRTRE